MILLIIPSMPKPQTTEDIFSEIERLEGLKEQAIQQLLADRKTIDERLAKLGYNESKAPKPAGKKRTRRTKAQIEADRAKAEGSEAHG
jgi:hypothetical protein